MAELMIPEVSRLQLRRDDTLVFRVREHLGFSQLEAFTEHVRGRFPDNETLVLCGDVELDVVAGASE